MLTGCREHLYRSHLLPKLECSRCFATFTEDITLVAHQRAVIPCELVTRPSREGIDASQEILLRVRSKLRTEKEKWEEVYKFIFPGKDEIIPTPCKMI